MESYSQTYVRLTDNIKLETGESWWEGEHRAVENNPHWLPSTHAPMKKEALQ